jgi:hypothetical protein
MKRQSCVNQVILRIWHHLSEKAHRQLAVNVSLTKRSNVLRPLQNSALSRSPNVSQIHARSGGAPRFQADQSRRGSRTPLPPALERRGCQPVWLPSMHVQELAPLSGNRPFNESQYRPFSGTAREPLLVCAACKSPQSEVRFSSHSVSPSSLTERDSSRCYFCHLAGLLGIALERDSPGD